MGRVAEKILDALEAEIKDRAEWDEAPGLYFLYLEGGEARVSQAPVPVFLWESDPPRGLARMAACLGDFSGLLQSVAPEGLHGAAFRCEAWAVDAGMPAPSGAARCRPRRWEDGCTSTPTGWRAAASTPSTGPGSPTPPCRRGARPR